MEIRHVDGRPGDVEQSCAEISRARQLLGFDPQVTLEGGLAELVASGVVRQ